MVSLFGAELEKGKIVQPIGFFLHQSFCPLEELSGPVAIADKSGTNVDRKDPFAGRNSAKAIEFSPNANASATNPGTCRLELRTSVRKRLNRQGFCLHPFPGCLRPATKKGLPEQKCSDLRVS